jgi:hypothetical protein
MKVTLRQLQSSREAIIRLAAAKTDSVVGMYQAGRLKSAFERERKALDDVQQKLIEQYAERHPDKDGKPGKLVQLGADNKPLPPDARNTGIYKIAEEKIEAYNAALEKLLDQQVDLQGIKPLSLEKLGNITGCRRTGPAGQDIGDALALTGEDFAALEWFLVA